MAFMAVIIKSLSHITVFMKQSINLAKNVKHYVQN